MFPTQWCQTFINLPGSAQTVPGWEVFGWYGQWWSYSPTINPMTFAVDDFSDAVSNWIFGWCGGFLANGSGGPASIDVRSYFDPASGVPSGQTWTTGNQWLTGEIMPLVKNHVVRVFSAAKPQLVNVRKLLCGVQPGYIDGDRIPSYIQAVLNADVQGLLTPVVSQGITFTPGMASYRDVAFYPYTACSMSARLGNCKRRGRQLRPATNWGTPMVVPT